MPTFYGKKKFYVELEVSLSDFELDTIDFAIINDFFKSHGDLLKTKILCIRRDPRY